MDAVRDIAREWWGVPAQDSVAGSDAVSNIPIKDSHTQANDVLVHSRSAPHLGPRTPVGICAKVPYSVGTRKKNTEFGFVWIQSGKHLFVKG